MESKKMVDYAVLNDANISREVIAKGLQHDIEMVAMTVSELLRSKEAMEALTECFWQRYVKHHEALKAQTELDLSERPGIHSKSLK